MDMMITNNRYAVKTTPAGVGGSQSHQTETERIVDELRKNLKLEPDELIFSLRASLQENCCLSR